MKYKFTAHVPGEEHLILSYSPDNWYSVKSIKIDLEKQGYVVNIPKELSNLKQNAKQTIFKLQEISCELKDKGYKLQAKQIENQIESINLIIESLN